MPHHKATNPTPAALPLLINVPPALFSLFSHTTPTNNLTSFLGLCIASCLSTLLTRFLTSISLAADSGDTYRPVSSHNYRLLPPRSHWSGARLSFARRSKPRARAELLATKVPARAICLVPGAHSSLSFPSEPCKVFLLPAKVLFCLFCEQSTQVVGHLDRAREAGRLCNSERQLTQSLQRERSRSRRRSRSPGRSNNRARSFSPRSGSRSPRPRRSRSPMTGQGAPSGGSGQGFRQQSHQSYEDRSQAREHMMSNIRDNSQQDRRVYVGNLSYDVKWHHLKDFMRQGGSSWGSSFREEVAHADGMVL